MSPKNLGDMKNNFKARSKFEQWVRDYGGTKKLAKSLKVNQTTVQHWCAGRSRPRIQQSSKILSLSKGKLTLKDILQGTNGL